MRPLIIVDVQPQFERSEQVVFSCASAVKAFKRERQPIFIVEFIGFGHTFNAITRHIMDYPNLFFVRKGDLDGSPQILNLIERCNIAVDQFNVCGIYRNECVLSTCIGLANALPDVPVIAFDDIMDNSLPSPMWDRLSPQVQVAKWGGEMEVF